MSDQSQTGLRCGVYDRGSNWKLFRKWWPSSWSSSQDIGLPPSLEAGEAWWLGLAAATWPGFVPAPLFVPYVSRLAQQPSKESCKWTVSLDVAQFSPSEIFLNIKDGFLVVEGKHEERRDEHGFIARCFTRKYRLPGEIAAAEITAMLSADGILTVEAPVPEDSVSTITVIPIKVEIEETEKTTHEQTYKEETLSEEEEGKGEDKAEIDPNPVEDPFSSEPADDSNKEGQESSDQPEDLVEMEETDKRTCGQTHEKENLSEVDTDATTAPQECTNEKVAESTEVQRDQDQPDNVPAATQQPEEKMEPEEEEKEKGDVKAEIDPVEDPLPSDPAVDSDKDDKESFDEPKDLESQESPDTDLVKQGEEGESSQGEEIHDEEGSSETAEVIPPEEQETVKSPASEFSSQEQQVSDIKDEHIK